MSGLLRPARTVGVAAAALLLVGAVGAPSASAGGVRLQAATVVTSVDGVVGASAGTGSTVTVGLTVTNAATNGARLGALAFVVPAGVTAVSSAGITSSSGAWSQTVTPCGLVPGCAAIVVATVRSPATTNALPPGGTVTASVRVRTHSSPTTLTFPFVGLGSGVFTLSGPPATVRVVDLAPVEVEASVPDPTSVGGTTLTVTTLGGQGTSVPFPGGTVTVQLLHQDPGATVGGVPFDGTVATLDLPASPTGTLTLPLLLTRAQPQQVTVSAAGITSSTGLFDVAPGDPATLQITSVTDTSKTPPLPSPAAGATFDVAYRVLDQYGNLAPSDGAATLSASGPGVLAAGPSVPADGTGVFSGVTYSVAQAGVTLTATLGAVSGSTTVDVVTVGATTTLEPGQPATLTTSSAGSTATAGLGNGADGAVSLTIAPCVVAAGAPCPGDVEVTLAGTFTVGDDELYSALHPASVTWTCSQQECPYKGSFSYGRSGTRPQVSDFTSYPIDVSLLVAGTYQPFAQAPSCAPLTDTTTTGQLLTQAAKDAGFCVDVNAITRANSRMYKPSSRYCGALSLPVLFVEDPKLRPS